MGLAVGRLKHTISPRLTMRAQTSSPSEDSVIKSFSQARKVFDAVDALREGYYEIKRDEGGSKQAEAQALLREAASMVGSLGLPGAERETEKDWSYTEADAHAADNRWLNVRPWDHTALPPPYLNASAVPPMIWRPLSLATASQPFVACQAPLPSALPDFCHHLLSSGCRLLVNLTPVFDTQADRQIRKSHQYWPDPGSAQGTKFDAGKGWSIETLSEDVQTTKTASLAAQPPVSLSSKTSRTLKRGMTTASSEDDWKIIRRRLFIKPPPDWKPSRLDSYTKVLYDDTDTAPKHPPTDVSLDENHGWTVTLLHVETWADGGHSSAANFTRLVELVEETQRRMTPASTFPIPPIWVHCSAGIGRTGTLIGGLIARALITSREPAILATPAEKIVLMVWRYLRERRYGMITTPQQAKMIYDEIGRMRRDRDL